MYGARVDTVNAQKFKQGGNLLLGKRDHAPVLLSVSSDFIDY